MTNFNFKPILQTGAFLIDNFFLDDNRGYFSKIFEKVLYEKTNIEFNVSESFISSSKKNVIRGMHFQYHNPQSKLISVLKGKIYDVIIDLRKNSKYYKKYFSFELNDKDYKSLLIPRGFAHGFLSMMDDTIMLYMCDGKYDKETDTGIVFNDKDINILWPITNFNDIIISKRDLSLMTFDEFNRNIGGL